VRAASEELPVELETPGARRAAVEWGGLRVSLERLSANAVQNNIPDTRCPCPHWGFLRSGRLRVSYPDHEELISAGDLYYAAPGHVLVVEEDCDVLELTPAEAWTRAAPTIADGNGKCSLHANPNDTTNHRAKGIRNAH
jgi:hypothetical protein